jgi:hypothetical protein
LFVIGSFPKCYSSKNADTVIKLIKNKLVKNNSNTKIYWNIKSNQSEPEQNILNILLKSDNQIENKIIVVNKRECANTLSINPTKGFLNIDLAVFSTLDSNRKKNFKSKVEKMIFDYQKVKLSLYNSQTALVEEYSSMDYITLSKRIDDFLNSSQKCDWRKSKYILQTVLEKNSVVKDTTVTFLIGDIVDFKEELVYRESKIKPSKKYRIFIDLHPKNFESIITNLCMGKIEYESIK